jgi:hypothetical protein
MSQAKPERTTMQTVYLTIHGEIEVAPGRYQPGIVSSSRHSSRTAAANEWERMLLAGYYDHRYERPEIRESGPLVMDMMSLG